MITIDDIKSIVTNKIKGRFNIFSKEEVNIYIVDIENQIKVIEYWYFHERNKTIKIEYVKNNILELQQIDKMYYVIAFLHYLPKFNNIN